MITCHRKYLEQRCKERGFTLADVMPCVFSMDEDVWTIDIDHDSYPRAVGALSFKCVPDCTTAQFPCEPGFCCEENLFDGTNSCLPCPSSSSYSSSNEVCCLPGGECSSTYNNQEECENCGYIMRYGCYEPSVGPQAGRQVGSCDECYEYEECDVYAVPGPCGKWKPGVSCDDQPCAPGACCESYYEGPAFCSVMYENECYGTWQGAGTSCDPNPCVECNSDGECPQGQYCCGGECALEPCPKCVPYQSGGCEATAVCGSGAGFGTPCDPNLPQDPTTPPLDCLGGGPSTVTVNGSGFTITGFSDTTYGNSLKEFFEGLFNTSYVVPLGNPPGCRGIGQAVFHETYTNPNSPPNYGESETFDVRVSVFVTFSYFHSVSVIVQYSYGGPAIHRYDYAATSWEHPTTSSCGRQLYSCGGFTHDFGNGASVSVV